MHVKLFPKDKNYILKGVQEASKTALLHQLVQEARVGYERAYNPLGLEDRTVHTIRHKKHFPVVHLEQLYNELAGLYRYRYGSDQLEFIFDGTTHEEKYAQEWARTFGQWARQLCQRPLFTKAVLEATVLYPEERKANLATARLRAQISQLFEFKVNKRKGIVDLTNAYA